MYRISELYDLSESSSKGFWLHLAFLFLVVLALHGRVVPYNNEFIYLLRLEPNFLTNDWSFAQPANEHWLFNLIFSVPARLLSIEVVGWLGRISCWLLTLAALLRLGKRWNIPYWAVTFSIGCWLAFGQSVVNAEWIFGTFEAKVVAYVCLLFALSEFSLRKFILPSILLGLSFSFHPAVGLWAIPSVGVALLIERVAVRDLLKVVALTGASSLAGVLPLLLEQSEAGVASPEDWEFVVTTHMPFHFDPYYFSRAGIGLLVLMLIFNGAALWRAKGFGLRFIRDFQFAIAAFFALGVILRWLEMFPLLRFMPMRLFPILTPLFFLFTAFYLIPQLSKFHRKALAVVYVVLVIGMLDPIAQGIGQLRENKASWVAKPDDFETALMWMSSNTPDDAVMITKPNSRKLWYLSKRAQIVSYSYPRYDRLSEWRSRIGALTSHAHIPDRASSKKVIEAGFDQLSVAEIDEIRKNNSATYLISQTDYPFPVIFRTETYRIYKLQ